MGKNLSFLWPTKMKRISIKKKQLLCHLLCGPRADLWPVYGLGCAKEVDLSLKRQAVNAVIFTAALMVGMSFVITLLTGIKKTLKLMTMTSRRRVITRTSCHECLVLLVRKSHFHCFFLGHRPFAGRRHFTTMTRILQSFAFLCKLGLLLLKPHWG